MSMRYCVVKLDEKKAARKVERWQAISETAAKQSKRSLIPRIHPVMGYPEALAYAASCDVNRYPMKMSGACRLPGKRWRSCSRENPSAF